MAQFDIAVIGLGAMGSAALATLARRGVRAVGIEQFKPAHDKGSSHGETRIIRLGYFEHPSYVPLLRRAYELWRELEAETGQRLMRITGIVEIGPPDSAVVSGTLAASQQHALPHEVMDAAETMRRFPAFRLPEHYVGVFQPDGGTLAVEDATFAQFDSTQRHPNVEPRLFERVSSVTPRSGHVRIETEHTTIEAGIAIVTAGAWLPKLLPSLPVRLRVTREVQAWFKPIDPAPFADGKFPVFLLENRHGQHYGFPPNAQGLLKIAKHHHANETIDPDEGARAVDTDDEALIRPALADHIPAANGALAAAKTCLYTMTPDGHFIIDRLPGAENIIVASPCSGHGFKFAPVIGEILSDLATTGVTRHDISRFSLARFG